MKRYLPFVIIALVALLAIGAGAMLYRAKRHPLPAAGDSSAFVGRAEDKTAHVRGGANAIVTWRVVGRLAGADRLAVPRRDTHAAHQRRADGIGA